MIKKNWVYLVFAVSLIIFIVTRFTNKDKDRVYLTIKSLQTQKGWGYEIYTNDTLYIKQVTIPAIVGDVPFATEKEALLIGNLALSKIKAGKKPTVSKQEIDSCGIHY
ncbi:MAG: DUF4907 domain-containing protein [Bacteroidota bacterium]|nr:DUF4907 domain-containing protein [Bacteroidota bacterium]